MDYLYILFAIAIFVAVALLVEGIYSSWNTVHGPGAKRIARRLRTVAESTQPDAAEVSLLKKRLLSDTPFMHGLLSQIRGVHVLDRLLIQSGSQLNVARFGLLSLVIGLTVLVLLKILGMPAFVAVALALAAIGIPFLVVRGNKRKRLAKMEQQLPEALDLMSRALRAGHALPSTIKMVCDEMADPLGSEFRIVFDEINYGIPMQESLKNLSARVPGSDMGFFVVAVLIHRDTGGNLTELLDSIAMIVRQRLKLFAQVKVFSAEARLSAWILGLLPFGLAAVLHVVNPHFMKTLWIDPTGRQMLGAMVVFMVLGVFWMRKIIRIKV